MRMGLRHLVLASSLMLPACQSVNDGRDLEGYEEASFSVNGKGIIKDLDSADAHNDGLFVAHEVMSGSLNTIERIAPEAFDATWSGTGIALDVHFKVIKIANSVAEEEEDKKALSE